MRRSKNGFLVSALMLVSSMVSAAQAHGILLPTTHISHATTHFTAPVSLSSRTSQNIYKSVIFASFKNGQNSIKGGTVLNGALTGTLYNNEVPGGSLSFTSDGPVSVAFGSNPNNNGVFAPSGTNFGNFVSFGSAHTSGPVLVTSLFGRHLSGSQSAFFSQYATVANGALAAGRAGGALQGGILNGTYNITFDKLTYINTGNYFIAFGNNPLNTGSVGATVTLPNLNSSLVFKNGLMKNISSAFLTGTITHNIYEPFTPLVGLPAGSHFLNDRTPSIFTFPSPPSSTLLF